MCNSGTLPSKDTVKCDQSSCMITVRQPLTCPLSLRSTRTAHLRVKTGQTSGWHEYVTLQESSKSLITAMRLLRTHLVAQVIKTPNPLEARGIIRVSTSISFYEAQTPTGNFTAPLPSTSSGFVSLSQANCFQK